MNPLIINLSQWEHRDVFNRGYDHVIEYKIWEPLTVKFLVKKIGNVFLCVHVLGFDENEKPEFTEEGISIHSKIFEYIDKIPILHYDQNYPLTRDNYIEKARGYKMLELDFGFVYRLKSPEGDFDVIKEITHEKFSDLHSHGVDFNLILELQKLYSL